MKRVQNIRLDEWLKEVNRIEPAQGGGPPGVTTEQLVKATGFAATTVRKMLRRAHAEGSIAVGWRVERRIDGKRCQVPVYSLVTAKRKGRK